MRYRIIKVTKTGEKPYYILQVKKWWLGRWKKAKYYFRFLEENNVYCGKNREIPGESYELDRLITIISVLENNKEQKYRGNKIYPVAVFSKIFCGKKIRYYQFEDVNWLFTYKANQTVYLGDCCDSFEEARRRIDEMYPEEPKKTIKVVYDDKGRH